MRRLAALSLLLFVASTCLWHAQAADAVNTALPNAQSPSDTVAYVDNDRCLPCHAQQAVAWKASHHAQAMALATPASVKGDFANREFRHAGVSSRFFRRGEKYLVRTDGPDGKLADFEITHTLGVEPLQQYLIAMPGGRLQALPIAWNTKKKEWFHLLPHEKTPTGDVLHWTGRYQTANTLCIVCHTTDYERRYDAAKDAFDSRWKEINVSCQSCHGPGANHLAWAKAAGAAKVSASAMGLTVDLRSGGAQATQDVCAPCHARRSELSAKGAPGQPLLDHFLPSLLSQGLYHPDGQQLDEVYVDGSFRQSKMFQRGVNCSHCHNVHSGKPRLSGNALCLQCHATQPNPAFPGAAGSFDSPAHHFHKAGSAGAQCVACHMPSRVYMGVQPRPDHSLRIPRPDLSVSTGSPNACNGCHAKNSAQWAADSVTTWYGKKRPPHYGAAFAAYRSGQGNAGPLLALIGDTGTSAIVRATALSELAQDAVSGLPLRISALKDTAPEVRAAAADGLALLEPARRMAVLASLLRDPVRAVRLAAMHSLSTVPRERLDAAARTAFDAALQEYIAVQSLALDMPGAQLNLAQMLQNNGQAEQAEQHYLAALMLDPDFSPARLNLAQLYAQQGRLKPAQEVLMAGLSRQPGIGELQYSLGLLLAQTGERQAAADALQKAARLLPTRGRVAYNLALAYQQLGKNRLAEQSFLAAAKANASASDPDVLYALAAFYYHERQLQKAQTWADQLRLLRSDDPRSMALQRALSTDATRARSAVK
jgi:tetratricopeptide (TPR) repeat protein